MLTNCLLGSSQGDLGKEKTYFANFSKAKLNRENLGLLVHPAVLRVVSVRPTGVGGMGCYGPETDASLRGELGMDLAISAGVLWLWPSAIFASVLRGPDSRPSLERRAITRQ